MRRMHLCYSAFHLPLSRSFIERDVGLMRIVDREPIVKTLVTGQFSKCFVSDHHTKRKVRVVWEIVGYSGNLATGTLKLDSSTQWILFTKIFFCHRFGQHHAERLF